MKRREENLEKRRTFPCKCSIETTLFEQKIFMEPYRTGGLWYIRGHVVSTHRGGA